MKLNEAVSEVLNNYPEMESHKFDWQFCKKVLSLMDIKMDIEIKKGIPSPDSLMREFRRQNQKSQKLELQEKKKENEVIVDIHLTKPKSVYTMKNSQYLP